MTTHHNCSFFYLSTRKLCGGSPAEKGTKMKLSKYFYVTLRETPSDATMPSHIFLMRGGYIKPLSTGSYSMMPMGFRVIQKITNIIREEMNKIGGIEVDLPVVQTAELWSESGRYPRTHTPR